MQNQNEFGDLVYQKLSHRGTLSKVSIAFYPFGSVWYFITEVTR